jgi:N-acetylneuraminate synthase|tara:strand:- start:3348 stop:4187 length:840 start_codon:yes stop_codon:yes gene_type:complete
MNTFVIAEIGINHNGSVSIAKQLIDIAKSAGCNAIKLQKRTIDEVYSLEELDKDRDSPWGTTNRAQKEGLEFCKEEYDAIDRYCKEEDIEWFASAWDLNSQKFLQQYNCRYNKVASALLTHKELLTEIAREGKKTFISTGMSTLEEIDSAIKIFQDADCPYELMHCNSTYPMKVENANLSVMKLLKDRYQCDVGYSGHETGIVVSVAAVAMGATSVERHITLDRSMYGSDQAASLEPEGLRRLVKYIDTVEQSVGEPKKLVTQQEEEIKGKLRRVANTC